MVIMCQEVLINGGCDEFNHVAFRRSRARNLNDVRLNLRETLSHSRVYSRAVQMMHKRKTLQESIRMEAAVTCGNVPYYSNGDSYPEPDHDYDSIWGEDPCCTSDSNSNDRSPSPTLSLASSTASSDSMNSVALDFNEFPGYMLEVVQQQSRLKRRPLTKIAQRSILYKCHEKFDTKRVKEDPTKIINDFQNFRQALLRNQTNRANILTLLSHDWQIMLNVMHTYDIPTIRDCIHLLISLLNQNLISLPLLSEMFQNNLLMLMKNRCSASGDNYCPLICRLLITILNSLPALTPMIFDLLASTQILDDLMDVDSYSKFEINENILLLHHVTEIIIENLSHSSNMRDHSPEVPFMWTKIIKPASIQHLIERKFMVQDHMLADRVENQRYGLSIIASIIKMLCANVDNSWACGMLDVLSIVSIDDKLSNLLKQGLDEVNCLQSHEEIFGHYAGFLSFYQHFMPDLHQKYNVDPDDYRCRQGEWDD